jgi:molybdate transport system ATP-binding protein
MIHVEVQHAWPDVRIDIRFEMRAGLTALVGRSGAGKTTVLNAIAGVLRPDRAVVRTADGVLADTDAGVWVPPHRRQFGYVFQEPRLFPHLTVRRNLEYGRPRRDQGQDVAGIVELLALERLLDRRTTSLSGGEKQRVALGRALVSRPRLLLLDEPLASVDQAHRLEILPFLDRFREQRVLPMIYVTHAVAEIATRADQVIEMG